jgi:hypothetical protein
MATKEKKSSGALLHRCQRFLGCFPKLEIGIATHSERARERDWERNRRSNKHSSR